MNRRFFWSASGRSATSCSRRPPSTRCGNGFLTRISPTSSSPRRRPSSPQSASRTRSSSRRAAGGCAACSPISRSAGACCGGTLRPRDRFSRRSARLAADLVERRPETHRLRRWPGAAGCTRDRVARPASAAAAAFGGEPVGSARGARTSRRRTVGVSGGDGGRRRSRRRGCRAADRAGVERRRSPHRHPRQRRESVPPMAGRAFRRRSRRSSNGDSERRVIVTSGPSEHEAAERVIAQARARLSAARS